MMDTVIVQIIEDLKGPLMDKKTYYRTRVLSQIGELVLLHRFAIITIA